MTTSIRLDDEGNIRLLDEQTFNHAHNLKSALQTFTEDLTAYSALCTKNHQEAAALSRTLLSLKAAAALRRAEVAKEVGRREDLKRELDCDVKYQTDELRKDKALLLSLKVMDERLNGMQENLFLN